MQFKTATRWCAAVAAAGVLAGSATASAQTTRAPSTEPGVPTGQISVQLFNYIVYVATGQKDGNPPTPVPTTQKERMARVFQFLQSQGIKNAEPFMFFGYTAPELRALADQYGVNLSARHGDVVEGTWDEQIAIAKTLGQEYIGSSKAPLPGFGTYANTLATAQTLNRLGKRAVEAGVGPVYIHNHTEEFTTKYLDDGVTRSAWEILLEHTDPRYVIAELDVLWAADAGYDPVALLNTYGARIKLLHMKDGKDVASPAKATPVPYGTGEIDFTRVINAAKGKVRYYVSEQDPPLDILIGGPNPPSDPFVDGAISFANLKGSAAPVLQALPPTFPPGQAGGTTGAPQTVTVRNRGDAPMTITGVAVQASAPDAAAAADFTITDQTCTTGPIAPNATCTVSVAFAPTRALTTSLARLQFTSNSDDATDTVMLVAGSGNALEEPGTVGGTVPSTLALSLGAAGSFGPFTAGADRTYDTSTTATVTSTAGDATLSVADASSNATGRLVNGAFSLSEPLQAQANSGAFAPLSATAGSLLALLSYNGPVSNDLVSVGLRQHIAANQALRTGAYSKTLTFTLSTTTP